MPDLPEIPFDFTSYGLVNRTPILTTPSTSSYQPTPHSLDRASTSSLDSLPHLFSLMGAKLSTEQTSEDAATMNNNCNIRDDRKRKHSTGYEQLTLLDETEPLYKQSKRARQRLHHDRSEVPNTRETDLQEQINHYQQREMEMAQRITELEGRIELFDKQLRSIEDRENAMKKQEREMSLRDKYNRHFERKLRKQEAAVEKKETDLAERLAQRQHSIETVLTMLRDQRDLTTTALALASD